MREYSTIWSIDTFKSCQCLSRMNVPSLSSGCEIAQFFVRHADTHLARRVDQPSATSPLFFDNLHFEHFDKSVNHKSTLKCTPSQTKILEG